MGLQLYQVDHRSYLLDFRNLNSKTDGHHPILSAQAGSFCLASFFLFSYDFYIIGILVGVLGEDNDMENLEPNRSISWELGDSDNVLTSSTEEPVSEVMEFFEMAASLIRTLAPDSSSKTSATLNTTASS